MEKQGPQKPFDLRCEYTVNPLGVDNKNPIFSWKLEHTDKNERQTAYQIIVSSSLENLQNNIGDMWDTGKVSSNAQIVKYEGKPLERSKTYYWKVKWWDSKNRESSFSDFAVFEMGLLEESNWKAKWISKKEHNYELIEENDVLFVRSYYIAYSPLFRKEFSVEKEVKRARVYISGLGFYELYVNGEKIGDRVLDPGQTDYNKRVLYTVYDVTNNIKLGKNAIGVILGNGRYVKEYGYDFPKFICQFLIEYKDGTEEIIASDGTWKVSYGPISRNSIYHGEVYDATKEIPFWNLPDFDDSKWENAIEVEGPSGKLFSEIFPPIKVNKIIKPVKMWSTKMESYVFDFGQNFTGWIKLRNIKAPKGTEIKIRYSELIHEDGTLNTSTLRNAKSEDIYITKGEGIEEYEPKFTYHGFRYVEITGYPGIPSLNDVEGHVVHTSVEKRGEFLCSNKLINKIHENIIWGQLSNLMSVPTDCPQRDERMGWMGDAQLSAEEAIFNFDMIGFYKKYLRDIKDAQREDGSLSDVIPPYWKLYPSDPAWGTAYITIAWYLYLYYGDEEVLREHYDGFKKYVNFLSKFAVNHILEFYKYGDWCQPGTVRPKDSSGKLTSTFYYYHDTLILSQIAKILGKKDDYEYYSNLAENIKGAFNREFLKEKFYACLPEEFNKESLEEALEKYPEEVREILKQHFSIMTSLGMFTSQTINVLPLYLNMVPSEEKKKSVLETLLRDITISHDMHLDTGIVGTRYIFDVLTDNGYTELAYKLVTRETYPGFGYMIKEGATTLWERWEKLTSSGMNSHNHIMFGSVDAWFYRVLAGIKPLEPGWNKILFEPHPVDDLKYAKGKVDTIKGIVEISWERNEKEFIVFITLPVNSEGELRIPKIFDKFVIEEDGKIIYEEKEKDNSKNYVSLNLGSGKYKFIVKKI